MLHLKGYYTAANVKFHWEILIQKFFLKLKLSLKIDGMKGRNSEKIYEINWNRWCSNQERKMRKTVNLLVQSEFTWSKFNFSIERTKIPVAKI